jgi:hypothetical protein
MVNNVLMRTGNQAGNGLSSGLSRMLQNIGR